MDYREGKKFADAAQELAHKLLAQEKITKEEEAQLMTAAQAAVFIWSKVGTPLQVARAHWLASQALCRAGEGKLAYLHAQLCDFKVKQSNDRKDYDEAFAIEALSRSYACKGDNELGLKMKRVAKELGQKIKDPQDREAFHKQLSSGPWFAIEGQE